MKRFGIALTRQTEEHVVLEFETEEEAREYVLAAQADELEAEVSHGTVQIVELVELCWEEFDPDGDTCELPKGHEGGHSVDGSPYLIQKLVEQRVEKG